MAKPERGLGKGLGALLGNAADVSEFRRPVQYINQSVDNPRQLKEGDIRLINVADIVPNPFQPRLTFDQQALEELAASIKALGLIQPITVRATEGNKFQIISGERRYRASIAAGMTAIPAYVRKAGDDATMLEMAIVENVQRADLDPIETAMSYQRLIDECHLTQEAMSEKIGKSRVAVTNTIRLLRLPAKVQYDLKVGNISVGHAKVLLSLSDSVMQEQLCDEIIKDGLSVRALESRIKALEKGNAAPKSVSSPSPSEDLPDNFYGVAEIIGKYFSNNVSVRRNAGGSGTITVRFSSEDQVNDFLSALKASNM